MRYSECSHVAPEKEFIINHARYYNYSALLYIARVVLNTDIEWVHNHFATLEWEEGGRHIIKALLHYSVFEELFTRGVWSNSGHSASPRAMTRK